MSLQHSRKSDLTVGHGVSHQTHDYTELMCFISLSLESQIAEISQWYMAADAVYRLNNYYIYSSSCLKYVVLMWFVTGSGQLGSNSGS